MGASFCKRGCGLIIRYESWASTRGAASLPWSLRAPAARKAGFSECQA